MCSLADFGGLIENYIVKFHFYHKNQDIRFRI